MEPAGGAEPTEGSVTAGGPLSVLPVRTLPGGRRCAGAQRGRRGLQLPEG